MLLCKRSSVSSTTFYDARLTFHVPCSPNIQHITHPTSIDYDTYTQTINQFTNKQINKQTIKSLQQYITLAIHTSPRFREH